jgi:UbiD family decarboxylase
MSRPEPPEVVGPHAAPVKEVVYRGDDVDLGMLPFFRNAEKDEGPGWITPVYVFRKFDSREYNVSWHRGRYVSRNRVTTRFYPGRELYHNFQQYRDAGEPMRCVAVIGHHPLFGDAAGTKFRGVDEYEAANGILKNATGSPLRVVPSELWGDELMVPADAEIVLEGHMLDEYVDAGPWCDYWRAYLAPKRQNIFEVSAITMRRKPIFSSNWPAVDAQVHHSAAIYQRLKESFPGVKAVHFPFAQTAIVSARPRMPGEAMHIAGTLLSLGTTIKTVIVIDDDCDPQDVDSIFFSLATRMDARRDVVILPLARNVNDPSNEEPTVGGLFIDATRPRDDFEFEIGLPPRDRIEAAERALPPDILQRVRSGSRYRI